MGFERRAADSVRHARQVLQATLCAAVVGLVPSMADAQTPPTDAAALTILTRTTMIALNHANRTGNYAVLRDLGSPAFAAATTPADLAAAFADIRGRDFDLGPVVVFDPQFTQQPAIDLQGRLRLTGFFATAPVRIAFDMQFESIGGRWHLFGLTVNPQTVQQPQPPAAANGGTPAQPTASPGTPQGASQGIAVPLPEPRVNPDR